MIDLHGAEAADPRGRLALWRRRIAHAAILRRFPHWWVFACAAIAVLSVIGANSLILWEFRKTALDDAQAQITKLDRVYAEAADRGLQSVDLVLASVVNDLAAKARAGAEPFARGVAGADTHALLKAKLGTLPQLDALNVIGANGDLLNFSRSYPPPPNKLADRDYFIALRDRPEPGWFISAPARNRGTGTWSIFFSRRLNAEDGSFAGVVVATIHLKYFEDFYRETELGPGGAVALWRDDGMLLARYPVVEGPIQPNPQRVRNFQELSRTKQALLTRIAYGVDPVPMLAAARPLRNYPLIMTVALTEEAVFAPWRIQLLVVGGAAAIGIVTIILIALLIRRHLIAREQVAAARTEIEVESTARAELERAVARADAAIEEHERAAGALRASEQRFRDVAEVAADVIWESGPDHRFTLFTGGSANEIAHRLGIDITNVLGKTRWELAGADTEHDAVWRDHKAELDAHRPFRQFRYSVTTDTGTRAHYLVSGKPCFDNAGQFIGYRGTGTNESPIVEAHARAERAEALLRDAVESISEGFVIYDSDDRLVMCNEAFHKLYPAQVDVLLPGTPFERVLRYGLARKLFVTATGREEEWLAERMRDHLNPSGPIETHHSTGRWLLISERKMRGGGVAGLRVDITALKEVQAALSASEERLNRAQRLAKMGSHTRDLRTNRVEWSDETYRIFGVTRENFTPTPEETIKLVHPDDRVLLAKSRSLIAKGVCPSPYEYRIVRPDGTIRHLHYENELVRDEAGEPVMVAGTIRDITDLRASEARQKELERQLQHSQRLKALGTLAGGIAHDLNNTLVPILSLSKLIAERTPAGSMDREDLETIVFASERARDLLQQILAFSRKRTIVRKDLDLAAVTHQTLQMMRVTVPAAAQILEQVEEVPPILGDGGQLQQVVVNLVTNGIQALGKKPGTVTVSVAPATRAEWSQDDARAGPAVTLAVADTGSGMDAATLERIFEPFYTTKSVGEGTGLGLSVVHGIITDHGGRIDVDSRLGKGTVFRVVLPVRGGDPGPSEPATSRERGHTADAPA